MKIALLSGLTVVHTVRWVNAFADRGNEVHVITCHPDASAGIAREVAVHHLAFSAPAGYYLNSRHLKDLLEEIRPDVLNAHFASGYGTLARLCGFHPYVLSVWGSDVYDFPYKSPIHREILRKNLLAADTICSTSNVMAEQVRKICPVVPDIRITPFGVDTDVFVPKVELKDDEFITIGTVKKLEPKYGIDTLLHAFAYVKEHYYTLDPEISRQLRLIIVGGGSEERKLKGLAESLGISGQCRWIGKVGHREIPGYLNQFDIYSALSRLDSESFGVAIIEASACELPVVVSDAGGLPEVVKEGQTGFVVPREKPEAAGKAMINLINKPVLRRQMGEKGREHVIREYKWDHCVKIMEGILKETSEKLKPQVS